MQVVAARTMQGLRQVTTTAEKMRAQQQQSPRELLICGQDCQEVGWDCTGIQLCCWQVRLGAGGHLSRTFLSRQTFLA